MGGSTDFHPGTNPSKNSAMVTDVDTTSGILRIPLDTFELHWTILLASYNNTIFDTYQQYWNTPSWGLELFVDFILYNL